MWAERIFASMLWCYPAPFRREYGEEMKRAFRQEWREARAGRQWREIAGIWLRSFQDIFTTAIEEHLHMLQQDLRYAWRTLAARPGFAAVSVLSLALGIGANIAVYSLVDSLLLRSLPVAEPESLVLLTDPGATGGGTGTETGDRSRLTYEEFQALQAEKRVFARMMAAQTGVETLSGRVGRGAAEDLRVRLISEDYFGTLGVEALAGRTYQASDGPRAPLAVVSYEFWQRRLGGRAEAVGEKLSLQQSSFTIVGVMPREFFGETVGQRPDVWLPLGMQLSIIPGKDLLHDNPAELQKVMWLHAFARLQPGVTQKEAQAAANVVFQRNLQSFYASAPTEEMRRDFLNQRIVVRPAGLGVSGLRENFEEPLLLLLAAAGLVLAIACANLGNLMMTRVAGRAREFSIRLALGAGSGNLTRQLVTECMLVALGGGILGAALAVVLRDGLLAMAPRNLQMPESFDLRVLAFGIGLTLAAGLALSALPVYRALRMQAVAGLREQGRQLSGLNSRSLAWQRAGKAVIAGQLALTLPLLCSAGLLTRTLQNLEQVDTGFSQERLLMARVNLELGGYPEGQRQAAMERLEESVRRAPGVAAVTYSPHGMMMGGDSADDLEVEGYVPTGKDDTGSRYDLVGPGFFSTLGIPMRLGREIGVQDRAGAPKVCVINEAFARKFFAGRNPLGRQVTQVYGKQRNTFTVVGVAANARKSNLRGEIEHRFYVPVAQPIDVPERVTFAVRGRGRAEDLVQPVRAAIHEVDPNLAITTATMKELLAARTGQDRMLARISAVFGGLALVLAAVGLYGVLSYGVGQRTSEIGVRKALGARDGQVACMVLRESAWLVGVGMALGALLAWGSAQWIESRLFGLRALDPMAIGGTVALLGMAALAAAWVPAWRASRVDPLVAIRHE
jgi:predicted permease